MKDEQLFSAGDWVMCIIPMFSLTTGKMYQVIEPWEYNSRWILVKSDGGTSLSFPQSSFIKIDLSAHSEENRQTIVDLTDI